MIQETIIALMGVFVCYLYRCNREYHRINNNLNNRCNRYEQEQYKEFQKILNYLCKDKKVTYAYENDEIVKYVSGKKTFECLFSFDDIFVEIEKITDKKKKEK